jgi:predicted metal-dependent hydrolase
MQELKYLHHYPESTKEQVRKLIANDKLGTHLAKKYPQRHAITNDKALFAYVNDYKAKYMKKAPTLSKVLYCGKIHIINNALGTHHFISRVQGSKLKAKNEIRVAAMFKNLPEEFLEMIVVHELAHFKEKEHNKAFYSLCTYMQPQYHQLEFDLRLYLTYVDVSEEVSLIWS